MSALELGAPQWSRKDATLNSILRQKAVFFGFTREKISKLKDEGLTDKYRSVHNKMKKFYTCY